MATTLPAADLRTGHIVRMYDDEVGTHLREVAGTKRIPSPHPGVSEVLVDWVGDDLPASVYPLDWRLEVLGG